MDLIVKEKVPPLPEVTLWDVGVTCRLEFGMALIVPGPVTLILTVAVLPLFFRTDTDPTLELIRPPTHAAVGGGMKVPPPPLTLHGLNSKWVKLPFTTADVATSEEELTLVSVTVPGLVTVESIVISPEPAT